MKKRLLADGLGWPEGPALLGDGRICFVETFKSQVSVFEERKGVRRYAYTGGGPNACVVGAKGELYVCQNGGTCGPWRSVEMVEASIQRIEAEGKDAEILVTSIDGLKLKGPNDLVFGPDGSLYFTDPGTYRPEAPDPSYIFVLRPDGAGKVLAELDPPTFPNGIAIDEKNRLIWTESYTGMVRCICLSTGEMQELGQLPGDNPVADGLAVALDGRLFVTTVNGGGIDILSPDGQFGQAIPIRPNPTNCIFADETLYVTVASALANTTKPSLTGSLWALEAGTRGVPIWRGSIR